MQKIVCSQGSVSVVKIIMVTDYNENSLRAKAIKAGANDYVMKENLLELKKIIEFTNN